MKRLEAVLTRILEGLLSVCLFAIAGTVVVLVILRYLFNSSITGANEAVTILFVYTTALGAAIAIGKREHIAIGLATEALSTRGRRIADLVGLILVTALNGVMLAYSIGWIRVTGDYLMPSLGLPRVLAQLSIPVGCGLAILYCLLRLTIPLTKEPGGAQGEVTKQRAERSDTG
jgi:TRAP-type C4-dicarboxylate transport system permease small subunit